MNQLLCVVFSYCVCPFSLSNNQCHKECVPKDLCKQSRKEITLCMFTLAIVSCDSTHVGGVSRAGDGRLRGARCLEHHNHH